MVIAETLLRDIIREQLLIESDLLTEQSLSDEYLYYTDSLEKILTVLDLGAGAVVAYTTPLTPPGAAASVYLKVSGFASGAISITQALVYLGRGKPEDIEKMYLEIFEAVLAITTTTAVARFGSSLPRTGRLLLEAFPAVQQLLTDLYFAITGDPDPQKADDAVRDAAAKVDARPPRPAVVLDEVVTNIALTDCEQDPVEPLSLDAFEIELEQAGVPRYVVNNDVTNELYTDYLALVANCQNEVTPSSAPSATKRRPTQLAASAPRTAPASTSDSSKIPISDKYSIKTVGDSFYLYSNNNTMVGELNPGTKVGASSWRIKSVRRNSEGEPESAILVDDQGKQLRVLRDEYTYVY